MIQHTYRVLVATLAFSYAVPLTVQAALCVEPQGTAAQAVEFTQQRILYVNPQRGTDVANAGKGALTPFKTITYALQQAKPGTVIQLAPGKYQAGETFPLQLKPGVILKGNESQQGRGVAIVGGGEYISRTFARQNITLLAAPNSQVIGVTVTNPNKRGTGIWVESTNPTIRNNTFANSKREGIFVTGTANPKIQNNQFINNDANGISVAGQAKGEIRGNVFQKNGFGLAIGGTSTPLVADNQIRGSRSSVVITQKARPILQGNSVENDSKSDLVAIDQAQPNVGNNDFQNYVEEVSNGEANRIPTEPPLPKTVVPGQSDNGIWMKPDRGILKEGVYSFPDGLVIYSNGNNAFCGFTSLAHYQRYGQGSDQMKRISEQDRAKAVSDMRDDGPCPLADADKNSRVFVRDISGNNVGNGYQLLSPSIAAQPQDKWVLIMGNRILVVTPDGKVFTHDISGNNVGNGYPLPSPSVGNSPDAGQMGSDYGQ